MAKQGMTRATVAGIAALAGMALTGTALAQQVIDQIPKPAGVLVPHEGVFWFGMFNLGLMVAAFVLMFTVAWRTRSLLPLYCLAGGALGGLVEPIFDGNIHVQFAEAGQAPNWYFYNVGYPWFVIPGNAMLGAPVYLMARKFGGGITRKGLWLAFIGWWMFNNCWEIPGTSIASYAYFGPQPFKLFGYPLWIGMMAGLGIPLAGLAVHLATRTLNGAMLVLTIVAMIPFAIYGSEVVTWPMWLALNGGATMAITPWLAALSLVSTLIAYNLMVESYLRTRDVAQ